jgi:hypothetical protein
MRAVTGRTLLERILKVHLMMHSEPSSCRRVFFPVRTRQFYVMKLLFIFVVSLFVFSLLARVAGYGVPDYGR